MILMRMMMTMMKLVHQHSRVHRFSPRQATQHRWPNLGFLLWLVHMGCTLEGIRVMTYTFKETYIENNYDLD